MSKTAPIVMYSFICIRGFRFPSDSIAFDIDSPPGWIDRRRKEWPGWIRQGRVPKSEHGYTLGWEPLQEYLEIFRMPSRLAARTFVSHRRITKCNTISP